MLNERTRNRTRSRAIASIQSGLLLFGFSILLAFFMAAVIFLNG